MSEERWAERDTTPEPFLTAVPMFAGRHVFSKHFELDCCRVREFRNLSRMNASHRELREADRCIGSGRPGVRRSVVVVVV